MKNYCFDADPYVKIWLIYKGKKVEKKKTYIIKRTLNPIFEEEFTFYTPMNRMRETQLEITVMDYDKIGRNDTIGKVITFIKKIVKNKIFN